MNSTEPLLQAKRIGAAQQIRAASAALHRHPYFSRIVCATLQTAQASPASVVLGSFVCGRENVIPDMFRHLLSDWHIEPAHAGTPAWPPAPCMPSASEWRCGTRWNGA